MLSKFEPLEQSDIALLPSDDQETVRYNTPFLNLREWNNHYTRLHHQMNSVARDDFRAKFTRFRAGGGNVIGMHPHECDRVVTYDPVGYMLLSRERESVKYFDREGRERAILHDYYLCYSFGVLHDWRRQGIFTGMVQFARRIYKGFNRHPEKGTKCSKLRFAVEDSNFVATDALRSLGFTPLEECLVNARNDNRILFFAVVNSENANLC